MTDWSRTTVKRSADDASSYCCGEQKAADQLVKDISDETGSGVAHNSSSSQVTCSSGSSESSCVVVDSTCNALNDARTCMTFSVECLTTQFEQCQKQKRSLPAWQRTWQQCPETVILCDISSPMQISACRRSVPRMMLCNRR